MTDFYLVEATIHHGFADAVGPADQGWAAQPWGALCEIEAVPATNTTLRASDLGYRSRVTDSIGLQVYPPTLAEAFSVDVSANLDPTQSAVAAAWGSLVLNNTDRSYDSLVSTAISDGQAITIYRGSKAIENFDGYATPRTTVATYRDSDGLLKSVTSGVARANDYTASLALLARGVTNWTWNSSLTGFSGTTLGASYVQSSTVGTGTITVAGSGTDGVLGIPYVDLIFAGTVGTSGQTFAFGWNANTGGVPAVTGTQWTSSYYAALTAGAFPAGTTMAHEMAEQTSGGVGVIVTSNNPTLPTGATLSSQRDTYTHTLAGGATVGLIRCQFKFTFTTLGAFSFTIRFAGPQVEGGVPNASDPVILTSTGPGSQAPTYTYGASVALNEAAATNYVLSTSGLFGSGVTVSASTDVSALLAGSTVWKSTRTVTGGDNNSSAVGVAGLPTTGVALRASCYIWIPWGVPAKSAIGLGLEGNVTGGVGGAAVLTGSSQDQWQRITATANLSAGQSSTNIVLRITPNVAGDVFYTTGWQLEVGSAAASSYIPAQTIPAVRGADLLYTARQIFIDPPYASLTKVFTGVMGPFQAQSTKLVVALRDASYYIEKQVKRSLYGGTGALDGSAGLTGTAKPILWGGTNTLTVANITPTQIDPANLIYQLHDGAATPTAVYDGGVALTNAGAVADLYSGSATAGSFRYDPTRGLFQLGSVPVFDVTADAYTTVSPALQIRADQNTRTALVNLLAVPPALISQVPATPAIQGIGVDASVTASVMSLSAGLFVAPSDQFTGIDFVSRLIGATGALLVPCRDGLLRLFVLAKIPVSGVSVLTFDDTTVVSITPVPLPAAIDPPPFRMRLAYSRNYTVQSRFAGAATASRLAYVQSAVRVVAAAAAPVLLSSYSRATDPAPIGSDSGSLDVSAASPQAVVNAMVALWGTQRRLYEIVVPASVGLGLDWGSIVTVVSDFDLLASPGKLGQIVGWRYSNIDATATFRVLV